MTLLKDTIRQNTSYCDLADIQYDAGFGFVQIVDRDGLQDDILIQGDDAYNIIDQARGLYEEQGDITYHEALCYYVKPVIESIWG